VLHSVALPGNVDTDSPNVTRNKVTSPL